MRSLRLVRLASLAAVLVVAAAPSVANAAPAMDWQTGIRAVGNGATIEAAVNDVDGSQTFLLTPNNAPFYAAGITPGPIPPSLAKVSAPLYLVTYPLDSTADTNAPFNCYTSGYFDHGASLYNCDHAQIPGIKGHDHLVGVPGSSKAGGDFNVQWHVFVTFFTKKGHDDGAMNTRILTLADLQAAQAARDVTPFIDTGIYFYCAVVSSAVYSAGTPLTFRPL
ncbi:MAG TPA: hypothetical protein VF802_01635 [Candidatus Limnocylindrales bacterium]